MNSHYQHTQDSVNFQEGLSAQGYSDGNKDYYSPYPIREQHQINPKLNYQYQQDNDYHCANPRPNPYRQYEDRDHWSPYPIPPTDIRC